MNQNIIQLITSIVLALIVSVIIPTINFVNDLDKRVSLAEYKIEQFNKAK